MVDPRVLPAGAGAAGAMLVVSGVLHWRRRMRMRSRLRLLGAEPTLDRLDAPPDQTPRTVRAVVGRVGEYFATRWPTQLHAIAGRVERAGLGGSVSAHELLGWRAASVVLAAGLGLGGLGRFGLSGLPLLVILVCLGWFGLDLVLARHRAVRQRAILRALPTVMDLLVLSLEAGMGLDRALRTIVREYESPLSDEIKHLLSDVELGLSRGEAFERMAERVGLEELQALSRAIVQTDQLGVSLVSTMQVQARDVRLARRRTAETEALRAPIKMLIPLVVFILPTLFLLLLGPVGLRVGAALAGAIP